MTKHLLQDSRRRDGEIIHPDMRIADTTRPMHDRNAWLRRVGENDRVVGLRQAPHRLVWASVPGPELA